MKFPMIVFVLLFLLLSSSSELSYNDIKEFKKVLENPYRNLKISPLAPMNEIHEKYERLKKKYDPGREQKLIEKYSIIEESFQKIKKERLDNGFNNSNDNLLSLLTNRVGKTSLTVAFLLLILIPINMLLFSKFNTLNEYSLHIVIFIMVYVVLDRVFPHYFKSELDSYFFILLIWCVLMFQNKITDFIFDKYLASKKSDQKQIETKEEKSK